MNEPLMLFAIGINKFTVNNWEEKKPKLLELIKLSDDDVAFLDAILNITLARHILMSFVI